LSKRVWAGEVGVASAAASSADAGSETTVPLQRMGLRGDLDAGGEVVRVVMTSTRWKTGDSGGERDGLLIEERTIRISITAVAIFLREAIQDGLVILTWIESAVKLEEEGEGELAM
jgi:hypothetical protein